jgi:hypothetical protein
MEILLESVFTHRAEGEGSHVYRDPLTRDHRIYLDNESQMINYVTMTVLRN